MVGTNSKSFMKLCLNLEGRDPLYLHVPTYWDSVEKQWIGATKTPNTKKMIMASGKNDLELQNNFNIAMSKMLHDPEYADEIFSMFKPEEWWLFRELEELKDE